MSKTETKPSEILSNYDANVIKGVKTCVEMNESILFIGETGTGKTTLINELAKEKKTELVRVSLNGATSTADILGKMLAKDGSTYWQDGVLVSAMKKGHWIVFDEINACLPEVLFALHSLLDDDRKVTLIEKDGEIIRPVPEFRFFACMNPSENYAGTKETNMALMSRFGGVFHIAVFPTHHELAVLERNKVKKDIATKLVNLASELRKMREKGDLYTFVSTRDIIQAGKLATGGLDMGMSIEFAMLNKMTQDEKADVMKSGLVKAYIDGKTFKSPEMIALEKHEADSVAVAKKYEYAYKNVMEEKKKVVAELEATKKEPAKVGLVGIDAKQALMLKKLGIKIEGI